MATRMAGKGLLGGGGDGEKKKQDKFTAENGGGALSRTAEFGLGAGN